jgi:hypothetical protein
MNAAGIAFAGPIQLVWMVKKLLSRRSIARHLLHHPGELDGVVVHVARLGLARHLLHHRRKLDGVEIQHAARVELQTANCFQHERFGGRAGP